MTSAPSGLTGAFGHLSTDHTENMPACELVLAPTTVQEAAAVLDAASEQRLTALVWGGGTHQGFGHRLVPDVIISTEGLNRIIALNPEDLTVVVEAGTPAGQLTERLSEHGQTAVLPEPPGAGTVGGAVAAGLSGWGRLRYGPIRDRTLEVVLATGDGRVVRAGAPLVKNVTGYDLPRLATGSFGSLGLIGRVALKLWPRGQREATVAVDDAERALATAYRPLAVIEDDGGARVYLSGTVAEVEAQAIELGGTAQDGLDWPEPLEGETALVVRVPPGLTRAAVSRVPSGWHYQAAFGVGEIRIAGTGDAAGVLTSLRAWATEVGGAAVIERAPVPLYAEIDPWGDPGPSLPLQRRVKEAFDPLGVCNPGRLPGAL